MKIINSRFLKNSLGIGLVEVMMGVAISGGLALVMAKLLENSSQGVKQIEAKSEMQSLKGILQNHFSNIDACTNTFSNLVTQANLIAATGSGTVIVPNIKDKLNNILYTTASTNFAPVTLTGMYLTNYDAALGTGALSVQSTFRKSSTQVVAVKPIKVALNFNINNSNPALPVLVGCSTMAIGGEWRLGGNAGTKTDGSDYFGTSDNVALIFKVNAQNAGRIDPTGPTFFGYNAGTSNNSGMQNTGFGFNTLALVTSGYSNVAVGYSALRSLVSAGGNTAVGHNALQLSTAGNNTAIGSGSQNQATTGSFNSCVGSACLFNLTTGSRNSAIGVNALRGGTPFTGNDNLGIGYNTGANLTSGGSNILVGSSAGNALTSGNANTAVGAGALDSLTTGDINTAIGSGALSSATTSIENTCVGTYCMSNATTGTRNTALGAYSLNGNGVSKLTGQYNTGIGYGSGSNLSTGRNNIIVGDMAGRQITTSSNNTLIGNSSGDGITTGSGNIMIGHRAAVADGNVSNTLWMDSTAAISPLIGGNFSTRTVRVDGNLGAALPAGVQPVSNLAIGNNNATGGNAAIALSVMAKSPIQTGISSQVDSSVTGYGYGVTGISWSGDGSATHNTGVWGYARTANTSKYAWGIRGIAQGGNTAGVYGSNDFLCGGWPFPACSFNPAIDAYQTRDWAGYFSGHVAVVGTLYTMSGSLPSALSDGRLKENIAPLENSLERILKLRGVSFNWNKKSQFPKDALKIKRIGFIAQEIEKVYPDMVSSSPAGKIGISLKTVSYEALIAPIVESIKEIYSKVLVLFNGQAELEKEIDRLNRVLHAYEARLKKLEDEKPALPMNKTI